MSAASHTRPGKFDVVTAEQMLQLYQSASSEDALQHTDQGTIVILIRSLASTIEALIKSLHSADIKCKVCLYTCHVQFVCTGFLGLIRLSMQWQAVDCHCIVVYKV